MTTLKRLSTIVIWLGITSYALLTIAFTDYTLVKAHYINLILLVIAAISYFFRRPIGYLMTLLLLIIGFFGKATCTVGLYFISIAGIQMSLIYLPLIILFLIMNHRDLPKWLSAVIDDKAPYKKEESNDEPIKQ